MRFPRSGKKSIFVFVLKKFILRLKVHRNTATRSDKGNVLLVKEFVFGRKSGYPIRKMPGNCVSVFPIFLQSVPNNTEILWILKNDYRKIRLLDFSDICHPKFSKILRQRISLQISPVPLQAESFRGFLFLLATQII